MFMGLIERHLATPEGCRQQTPNLAGLPDKKMSTYIVHSYNVVMHHNDGLLYGCSCRCCSGREEAGGAAAAAGLV